MNIKVKNAIPKVIKAVLCTLFIAAIIFPFYWQVITSFKTPEALFKIPADFFPKEFSLDFYISVFTSRNFGRYLINSLVVSFGSMIICMVVACLAAYAFGRLRFKGKKFFMNVVLAVNMFPAIAIVSPLFVTFRKMGLINTYWGLIIPYITFVLPLAIWSLAAFFKEIPMELEEAAKVDGCTHFQAFWHIILPITGPGLFSTAIIAFITAWNEFMFGLIFVTNEAMRTVPVGISMFQGEYELPWGDISAASVLLTVPVIIIVLIFQRKIISGLTAGAVKG